MTDSSSFNDGKIRGNPGMVFAESDGPSDGDAQRTGNPAGPASTYNGTLREDQQPDAEQLQIIKAKTMYKMVDEVPSSSGNFKRRVLFLTNQQADLIASSPECIQRMLDALEITKPKLVINLMPSWGFKEFTSSLPKWPSLPYKREDEELMCKGGYYPAVLGMSHGEAPFASREDERAAIERIDRFMTNAIVICEAVKQTCILSSSLRRMLALVRGKFGGHVPFTILSTTSETACIQANNKNVDNAEWMSVMKGVKAWQNVRDDIFRYIRDWDPDWGKEGYGDYTHDIDANADCLLIVDAVNKRKGLCHQRGPHLHLVDALLGQLGETLPSVNIRTGSSDKCQIEQAPSKPASLDGPLRAAVQNSPVIFLDARKRPKIDVEGGRRAVVKKAKEEFEKYCNELRSKGLAETFDMMAIAHFQDVLLGDADPNTTTTPACAGIGAREAPGMHSIHDAIITIKSREKLAKSLARSSSGRGKHRAAAAGTHTDAVKSPTGRIDPTEDADTDANLPPADAELVSETVNWLAHRIFKDGFEIQCDRQQLEDEANEKNKDPSPFGTPSVQWTYEDQYWDNIHCTAQYAKSLITNPNFYGANLCDIEGVKNLLDELVQLNRLPKTNPLSGMILLREAWCEHDIAVHLAGRYKTFSKCIFLFAALLSWLVVASSSLRTVCHDDFTRAVDDTIQTSDELALAVSDRDFCLVTFDHITFGISVALSFVVFFEKLMNAHQRWRRLRSAACVLEGIIWRYRSRIGKFTPSLTESSMPELQLRASLNEWMEEVVSGAGLQETDIDRYRVPGSNVFTHFQYKPLPKAKSSARRSSFMGLITNRTVPLGDAESTRDDHHCPVKPELYIDLRLRPAIHFYQSRLPQYALWGYILQITISLSTVLAATLSYLGMSSWVTIVTAAGTAMTSWMEFSNVQQKIERYTRAVRSLKMHLNWWTTLSSVEKAGQDNISRLVNGGENIIADERAAWHPVSSDGTAAVATPGHAKKETTASSTTGNLKEKSSERGVRSGATIAE